MGNKKRATILLDSDLHRALRVKAAIAKRSISDLVNDAVRLNFAEDAEDLAAYRARGEEPGLDLDESLKDLRRRGKL